MGRLTEGIKHLLIINVLFFLATLLYGDQMYQWFSLYFPENPNFRFWQPLTHMFMHGGTSHILFNMFALYMFGSHIENALGKQRFLFLYFSAGFGAALLQVLFHYYEFLPTFNLYLEKGLVKTETAVFINDLINGNIDALKDVPVENSRDMVSAFFSQMVGASGAVFGILVAFAVLYPNLPLYMFFIPVPIKAKYLIGAYFLFDVYAAITGHNIIGPANTANWAHIGGAIVGFIIIWYWKKNSFNDKRWY